MQMQSTSPAQAPETIPGEPVTPHVRRGPDGVFRWYYALPMLKNPVILFTVWKVLGIAVLAVYLFLLIVNAATGSFSGWSGFGRLTGAFALLALGLGVLAVLAYLLVAAAYGWHYIVLFEMDETGIRHIQAPRQFKNAEALAWMALLGGAAAGQPSAAATGLLAMTRNVSTSEFARVRSVAVRPRQDLIRLNQRLERNQVYAAPEDFDFVRDHILARCGEAKKR